MPAFFILFIFLAIRVSLFDGAIEGYKFLFVPKWEYLLNKETWIMAMGQAFFLLIHYWFWNDCIWSIFKG